MTFSHHLENSKMLLEDGEEASDKLVILVGGRSSFARKFMIEETLDVSEGQFYPYFHIDELSIKFSVYVTAQTTTFRPQCCYTGKHLWFNQLLILLNFLWHSLTQ